MDTNEAVVETVETPAAVETPPGRVSVGDSVRAALDKAATRDEPTETPAVPAAPESKARAPDGKFAKPELKESAPTEQAQPSEAVETPKATIKAPQSLKGELKTEWDKLDPKWQGEIDRLERDARNGIQKNSQLASVGKSLLDEFAPYQDMMRAAGATPQTALNSFLKTEYMLRTSPPQQKLATFVNLARHYGIDLTGIAQGQVPQIDPHAQALAEENLRLRQEQAKRTNAESTQLNSTITDFASDPAHPHFEAVRQHMGALMETGAANTLDDAYEQACWANPTIRNSLIQTQHQEAEAKRKADERKAVEAKKAAGGSVKGTPASPIAAVAGKKESVGDTIRRVAAQAQGRI